MGHADDLSEDDILGIMTLLPFSSLVRASAVCKRWQRLARVTESEQISSWCILSCPATIPSKTTTEEELIRNNRRLLRLSSFKEGFRRGLMLSRTPDSNRDSYTELKTDNFHVVMFDPWSRKWLKVANPFGYKGPFSSPTRELLWVPSTGGYSGLVCVFEWDEESCHMFNTYWVGNPASNKWKCIVGPSPWRGVHQLVVNPTTKSYKIISIRWERLIPSETTGVWRATIYDSETDKWKKGTYFSLPEPPSGTPYCLSSRTHTASDKIMYLLMYRAGKLLTWETYTEIQIVGYDIENDTFTFVTPLSCFHYCLNYFDPTSCRDWPVHLVLPLEQLQMTSTGRPTPAAIAGGTSTRPAAPADDPAAAAADPPCPTLVICKTDYVRQRKWYRHRIVQKIINIIKLRPCAFHKEFLNELCILEFNPASASWDVKEESSSRVTGKFYSKDRVFHCAGDRQEHLYCAQLDERQCVVVYNAEKDDFSTWTPLPPLGDDYGGHIAKNYHSMGSFVPRLDAVP